MTVRTALPFVSVFLLGNALSVDASINTRNRNAASFDVLHYDAAIEPDIFGKSIKGSVTIRVQLLSDKIKQIEFDCGDLTIDSVRERGVNQKFLTHDHRLIVSLSRSARETRSIEIVYHGAPHRGIRFFPDQQQVYTVFATSQWLVCLDKPEDRSTLSLKLILPADLIPVANGDLISRRSLPDRKVVYSWTQKAAIPSYIFGFAAGPFRSVSEKQGRVEFRYVSAHFSESELRRIFRDTPDMLAFYEDRSGVRYADPVYTQVLATGSVEQEMSSFTALGESYGKQVLANERDIWLGAHELAHQWWGNMVTCRDWNHFWLNEGMANFMTAAYIEHRFGRADYLREIENYHSSYERVRQAGKDKSLVFPDWLHPTAQDRTLVYDKGAYLLHLLREELGEQVFWKGIREYTRAYFGKAVTTADFQTAMEHASGKDLGPFFAKWVYLTL